MKQLPYDIVAIAPRGLEAVLADELGPRVLEVHDRLFMVRGRSHPYFAQNIWLEPKLFQFQSISEAAKHLRDIQRNWWLHSVGPHRRAQLIKDKLPPLKAKRIEVLSPVPQAPLGAWTLLDESTLLYSSMTTSPFPDGEIEFNENKTEPPSRAYLKLWELFTTEAIRPREGERVVDLGSSPGGWTWVLGELGCKVVSVDKAPLAEALLKSDSVEYRSESAFALKPEDIGPVSWMFSDIICYPDRLLELVKRWESVVPNLVCTIKFQGDADYKIVEQFLAIPGSRVRHLSCNKHELTWWRIKG